VEYEILGHKNHVQTKLKINAKAANGRVGCGATCNKENI
jgi:hypothetical protein